MRMRYLLLWKTKQGNPLESTYRTSRIRKFLFDKLGRGNKQKTSHNLLLLGRGICLSHLCEDWSEVKVTQACLTLCNLMDYTVWGILQARILKPFPSPGDLPNPGDGTQVFHIAGGFFTIWATREAYVKVEPAIILILEGLRCFSTFM